jgi:hypothetical protein
MTKERDKLLTQIEEQQSHVFEMESIKKHYNDMVGCSKVLFLFVVQLV